MIKEEKAPFCFVKYRFAISKGRFAVQSKQKKPN
jgi:hypothetical protein